MISIAYHDTIWMIAFVFAKLLPCTKTCWTYVHSVARLTYGIRTFYSNRVGEVAGAAVALDLQARLVHSYI